MTFLQPPSRNRVVIRAHAPAGGAATLVVVMVLFFVMAMVAAYTNRTLIYEQRMSVNSYRAATGFAAGDSAIDWAIAMLNGGRIDTACLAPAAPTVADLTFRERYTTMISDGTYSAPTWDDPPLTGITFKPSCVLTTAGLSCSCPEYPTGVPAAAASAAASAEPTFPTSSSSPVFMLEIGGAPSLSPGVGGTPGMLTVNARGAYESSYVAAFKRFGNYNRVSVNLGLARALPATPVATLTAGRDLTANANLVKVVNDDPKTGMTMHVGGLLTATNLELSGPAGSANSAPANPDADLTALSAAATPAAGVPGVDFFQSMFGMDRDTYRLQPAAVRLACGGGCASADVAAALVTNPTNVIWVNGNLNLDAGGTLGSVAQPVLLVVNGDVTVGAASTINGFVYSDRDVLWNNAGALVRGAMVARRDFVATTPATLAYDTDILQRINFGYGSFVRIPGSWRIVPTK